MDVDWDRRFLELAKQISSWSKDPKTKVGAVIANDKRFILGTGYNGFPRGVEDRPERYEDHDTKYAFVVHADLNAILNCEHRPEGATFYIWPLFPCNHCAKAIIQAGIKRVVSLPLDEKHGYLHYSTSIAMFNESGVKYDFKSEE